jgi:poly-gamma-glutamate capsule biosynthesis protein CapA/YwtB (metallophosphatase superfamily)
MKLINKLIVLICLLTAGYLLGKPDSIKLDPASSLAQISETITNQAEQTKPIELIFVGDIMLDRGVEEKIKKSGDWRWPFLAIASTTQEADIIFGNLEGPVSELGQKPDKQNYFEIDPRVVAGLNYAGFNVLSLANNHAVDFGQEALADTLVRLTKAGIGFVGAGQNQTLASTPLTKEINGIKIAFLAYNENCTNLEKAGRKTPGINCLTMADLENFKKEVAQAKKSADILIISLHYGQEFTQTLSQFQIEFSQAAIDSGADLVLGHHPHVVQKYEQYKNGWIFYSLGNFVFDHNFSEETRQGLLVKTTIENKKIKSVEPIKTKINNSFQVELASLTTTKAVKGAQTTKNILKPAVSLLPTKIYQGSTLLIQLKNINNLKNITGTFLSKKIKFFKLNNKFYGLTSIAAKTKPGNYQLAINFADGSKIKKTIKVNNANFKKTVLIFTPELEKKGYNATSVAQTIANNDQIKLAQAMATSSATPYFNSAFGYPLEKIIKVGAFGSIRKSGSISLQHLGVDLDADTGTNVFAINDGQVVGVLDLIDYGNTIVVDHGVGIFSLYLHLDKFKVELGQEVKKGQVIGLSGNTGYSIGPHLHFSVKLNGSSVDPLEFIKTVQF